MAGAQGQSAPAAQDGGTICKDGGDELCHYVSMVEDSTAPKILVLGATGRVGAQTLRALAERAGETPVRAYVRRPEALPNLGAFPLDIAHGTLEDHAALTLAMTGIESVLLVSGDSPDQVALEGGVIEAAKAVGGIRIVKVSAITADLSPRRSFGVQHGAVEDHLIALGLDYVIVRPTFFYQSLELLADPIGKGMLPAATGKGEIGFVDLRDVAEVAAAVLLDNSQSGQIHILTGPALYTMGDVAAQIHAIQNHKVRHISPPRWLMPYLLRFGAGLDPWLARQVADLMACCAEGGEAVTTDAVETLLGKAPRTLQDYLARDYSFASTAGKDF